MSERPEITIVPEGKRGEVKFLEPEEEGQKRLVQVMDVNGRWIYAPVPDVVHVPIPEHWHSLSWFIVSTINKPQPPSLPRLDQLAMVEIMAQGFPVVMPVAKRKVRELMPNGRTGNGWVDMPKLICSGYVLVGMGHNDIEYIKSVMQIINHCRHVGGFVGQGDRPVKLTYSSVKRLFVGLNEGLFDESRGNLNATDSPVLGKLAQIIDGPMELITGVVDEFVIKIKDDKPIYTHAFIEADMLGRKSRVKVPIDSLRRVD